MAAFQKWVHSCGDGKAVEATMRLTRVTEELRKDAGKFKTWSKILAMVRTSRVAFTRMPSQRAHQCARSAKLA